MSSKNGIYETLGCPLNKMDAGHRFSSALKFFITLFLQLVQYTCSHIWSKLLIRTKGYSLNPENIGLIVVSGANSLC